MMVRFSRLGGRIPPQDNEGLEIDESGNFRMWRSVAQSVGRFAGRIDAGELGRLKSEVEKARPAGDFSKQPSMDGAVDLIDVEGAHASLGSNDYAEGDWSPLVDHLRRLLGQLVDKPEAAIGLDVARDGRTARLVHLGRKPIAVDLSNLSVRAVLWERGYRKVGDWVSPPGQAPAAGQVTAGDAWSVALPLAHDFELKQGQVLHVYASFAVSEDGQRADVQAQSTPPVPE